MGDEELDELDWCNKCVSHVRKTREAIHGKSLEVQFGVNSSKMTIKCNKCTKTFTESHSKRIDQIECQECYWKEQKLIDE